MAILKTDYKDDILDTSQNTKRKYAMSENQDDTVSFDDETEYLQEGDSFGAQDINATNAQVNTNTGDIQDINNNLTVLGTTVNSMKLRYIRFDVVVNREGGWGYWNYVTINHGLSGKPQIFPIECKLSTDLNVLAMICVQNVTSTTITVTINARESGTYHCGFLYDFA